MRKSKEKSNKAYKKQSNKNLRANRVFEVGDLVWVYLHKERFPNQRMNNLLPRADGPFKVVEKLNHLWFRS